MAPSMTRRAMFWTLSSLLLLVLAAVPNVVDAYSMVGRTVAVYTLVRIDESAPQVVPASVCRLLLSIFCVCGFQVSRVSSFTPRKVGVSVWDTISSFSHSLICSFEVEREKRVLFVLLVFISRPQFSAHLLIPLIASWVLSVAVVVCSDAFQIARSSACSVFETLFNKVVRISLTMMVMIMINNGDDDGGGVGGCRGVKGGGNENDDDDDDDEG